MACSPTQEVILLFLSLFFPTAFNMFQVRMVKLLISAGWGDAATELRFLIFMSKCIVRALKLEFLWSCIVCSCEGAAKQ